MILYNKRICLLIGFCIFTACIHIEKTENTKSDKADYIKAKYVHQMASGNKDTIEFTEDSVDFINLVNKFYYSDYPISKIKIHEIDTIADNKELNKNDLVLYIYFVGDHAFYVYKHTKWGIIYINLSDQIKNSVFMLESTQLDSMSLETEVNKCRQLHLDIYENRFPENVIQLVK